MFFQDKTKTKKKKKRLKRNENKRHTHTFIKKQKKKKKRENGLARGHGFFLPWHWLCSGSCRCPLRAVRPPIFFSHIHTRPLSLSFLSVLWAAFQSHTRVAVCSRCLRRQLRLYTRADNTRVFVHVHIRLSKVHRSAAAVAAAVRASVYYYQLLQVHQHTKITIRKNQNRKRFDRLLLFGTEIMD